jgi:hypothetical protein
VLEVNMLSIDLPIDYGYNGCRGFLPDNCDTALPPKNNSARSAEDDGGVPARR